MQLRDVRKYFEKFTESTSTPKINLTFNRGLKRQKLKVF